MFVFFFSSRRRHTRCGRDWSSDVCSSDLKVLDLLDAATIQVAPNPRAMIRHLVDHLAVGLGEIIVILEEDRKSTRLNSSHVRISYAVFCLKKKKKNKKRKQITTTNRQNSI